jgi:hypothetical protein
VAKRGLIDRWLTGDLFAWLLEPPLRAVMRRLANPGKDWPPRVVDRLEYDETTSAMNGVRIEDPIDALRIFGPADWTLGISPVTALGFSELGLVAEVERGLVDGFRVLTAPSADQLPSVRRFRAAELTLVTRGGLRQAVAATMRPADLAPLGEAADVTTYDDRQLVTYADRDTKIQIVFWIERPSDRVTEVWIA